MNANINHDMREDIGNPFEALVEIKKHLDEAFNETISDGSFVPDISVIQGELLQAGLILQRFLPPELRDWTCGLSHAKAA